MVITSQQEMMLVQVLIFLTCSYVQKSNNVSNNINKIKTLAYAGIAQLVRACGC
jgi:hypothetical protein